MSSRQRPVALVTGAGRTIGIGAAVVATLADRGWDVAWTRFPAYEARIGSAGEDAAAVLAERVAAAGGRSAVVETDLADPAAPEALLAAVEDALGPVTALVLSHAESVDSDLMTTTVESFDRHFAVNTRASWLLIRAFAARFTGAHGAGRIVALTSDHTAGNLPYGASKGALDRIVIAAAEELRDLGIAANAVNPGPTETGWIGSGLRRDLTARTALGRLGTPQDAANLIAFLCSPEGGWVNGQLLMSNGGFPVGFRDSGP